MFSGDEDPKDWLESYEEAAQHNGWAAAVRLANFGLFLAGPAKKWFKNTVRPDSWTDMPGVGEAAARPGMKSHFLATFLPADYTVKKAPRREVDEFIRIFFNPREIRV